MPVGADSERHALNVAGGAHEIGATGVRTPLCKTNAGHLSPEPIVRPTILRCRADAAGGWSDAASGSYVTHTSARALGILTSSVTQTGRETQVDRGRRRASTILNLGDVQPTIVAFGVLRKVHVKPRRPRGAA